jgi:hypothetical protein
MHDRQLLAVGTVTLVRRRQAAQHADADRRDQLPARTLAALVVPARPRTEVDRLDPLHHHVEVAVFGDEVTDLGEVRRLELRAEPRLLDEHLDVVGLHRERRVHLLHRDHAAEAHVAFDLGAPHVGHAAAARDLDEAVPTPDEVAGAWRLGHQPTMA